MSVDKFLPRDVKILASNFCYNKHNERLETIFSQSNNECAGVCLGGGWLLCVQSLKWFFCLILLAILHKGTYNLDMKKTLGKQLFVSMKNAGEKLSKLTPSQKKTLEKSWDIEHAYYSSALEGSKIDRTEFERLGKKVA